MARLLNLAGVTATDTQSSSQTAVATVTATAGKAYQILGFDGASSDQPFKVVLTFGSTDKVTMQGAADTSVGRDYGDSGPIAADNTAIQVTTTPAATGNCTANLIYRVVF